MAKESTDKIKTGVIKGFFWKAMESGGDQLITFVISILLARLLGPEKYGTMAVMLIFISIANVIIQNGFQTALIQKAEIDEKDLSSVFWLGLVIAGFLYALISLLAPLVASFFEDETLKSMLRTLSLILFIGSSLSVEIAIVARRMDFRLQCIATVIADILSGAIGVISALRGAGTWALIMQQLFKSLILMLILNILLKWRPKFSFDLSRIKVLFSYGWKVLMSGLIDTIYSNIYTPFISKLYSAAMVGFYNRANQFPQVISNSMATTLQSVLLPAFSKAQNDKEGEKRLLRRSLKLTSFLMFPIMFGIMAVARPMVMVLLGEDWLPAVPFLRLLALSYSVWHIHVANLQAVNALGHSEIYLRLELIKKFLGVVILLISIPFGLTTMIFMKAAFDYICTFINAFPNKRLISYGPVSQWKDVGTEFILSLLMAVAVHCFESILVHFNVFNLDTAFTTANALILLCLQVLVGVIIYFGLSLLLRIESVRYLKETLDLYRGKNA